jgi:hypothetical protein
MSFYAFIWGGEYDEVAIKSTLPLWKNEEAFVAVKD